MQQSKRTTVGIYLDPHTRDRLNKFVADQRLASGKFLSQGRAIAMLLDHYPPQPTMREQERIPEYVAR